MLKYNKIAASISLALATQTAIAAEHPLTKVHDLSDNSGNPINVIDMVMSIDWDFDNPPAGKGKEFIETVIKQASQSLYTMTEGYQMLGKVSVYKNSQFIDNTDIMYLQQNGRANASVAGLQQEKGARIQMFAGADEETVQDHGKIVAHEMGHYVLGLYDEYQEQGKLTSEDPGSALEGDTPKDSIMHEIKYSRLSTASDYADPDKRKTAQYRVYNLSAWETLVRDPANEKLPDGFPARIKFKPFTNLIALDTNQLHSPTTGWENYLQVVYMGAAETGQSKTTLGKTTSVNGPINVIVIDSTLPDVQLHAQLHASMQVVDTVGDNTRLAVYAHPNQTPIVAMTRLTEPNASETIQAAIAAITSQGESSTLSATLQKALDGIKQVVTDEDTPTVTLLTKSQSVDKTLGESFDAAKVAVNPIVLVKGFESMPRLKSTVSDQISLYDLAELTNGLYSEAKDLAGLASKAVAVANEGEGDNAELVTYDYVDSLQANKSKSSNVVIAGANLEGATSFAAYWSNADEGKITFTLTDPKGTKITPTTLPAGVEYFSDPEEGMAEYLVDQTYANRTGIWNSTVTANDDTIEAIYQDAIVESTLSSSIDFIGGTEDDKRPLVAVVKVSEKLPVKDAEVFGDIYSMETFKLVGSTVIFKDDGNLPDFRKDDGLYSASLASLPIGEYEIIFDASGDGNAVLTTSGSLKKGTNAPDVPIPAFQRVGFSNFLVEIPMQFPLKITKAGTGKGTVTSAPAGINCGPTCNANFAVNSNVVLTAAAAGGSTFANWRGACTGTVKTCTVAMIAAKTATATFNLAAKPDFTIPVITIVPSIPLTNGTFTATVTVKNQSSVAADGGQLRLWTNQPTVPVCAASGGNKNVAVGTLAAGASKNFTNAGLSAGTKGLKTLRAFVDATCVKAESNETNNQSTLSYRVADRLPDLIITNITLTPPSPVKNTAFKAAITVKNQGATPTTIIKSYLDVWANQVIVQTCGADGNAWAEVGVLAAGASTVINVTGLSSGATAGAKTLRAFIDSRCEEVELNETNNQMIKTYTVQ